MPPRAIARRVCDVISVSPRRSRNSIAEAGGNFGAPPKPPLRGSYILRSPSTASSSVARVHRVARRLQRGGAGEPLGHAVAAGADLVRLLLPPVRHRLEHVAPAGHAVALLGREVGARVERHLLRGQEHVQRPAAAAGHRLAGLHVDRVQVRALLAVELHAHEALVHQRRRSRGPRRTRAPSRGTSGRPSSRSRAGSAPRARPPRPAPPRPRGTSPPGCPCAGGGRARSLGRGGSACASEASPPRSAARRILPLAVFGQRVGELDQPRVLVRRGALLHVVLELGGQRLARLVAVAQHHHRAHHLAALLVGRAHGGGLGHRGVGHQRGLHLERPDPVPGGDDHVVAAALEPEVAVLVLAHAVAGAPGALRAVDEEGGDGGRDRRTARRPPRTGGSPAAARPIDPGRTGSPSGIPVSAPVSVWP